MLAHAHIATTTAQSVGAQAADRVEGRSARIIAGVEELRRIQSQSCKRRRRRLFGHSQSDFECWMMDE